MKTKLLLPLIFFLLVNTLLWGNLPVYIDCNRFLTEKENTDFEITYKIFHRDLRFKQFDQRLTSQIRINFIIEKSQGKKIYEKQFKKRITSHDNLEKGEAFFIDKIDAVLRSGNYLFHLRIMDEVSGEQISWQKKLSSLPGNKFALSDIEISSFSKPAKKNELENFQHDSSTFLVNPNRAFLVGSDVSLTYYFELYLEKLVTSPTNITTKIINQENKTVFEETNEVVLTSMQNDFWKEISIEDWDVGRYTCKISASNPKLNQGKQISHQKNIFIKEKPKLDLEGQYDLAQYFLSNKQKNMYKSLAYQGKKNFLDSFWQNNDPNPKTTKNEFKELIEQRVEYAKKNYTSLTKDWKTDRGRLYVLYGKPDERVERGFDYQAKPFIIWKYISGGLKRVYLFVDFTGQGNYRLVWSKNDDNEVNDPQWESYLGPYFDENLLE